MARQSKTRIELTDNLFAVISAKDYDKVKGYSWRAGWNGAHTHVYACTNVRLATGKRYTLRMHRLLVGAKPGQTVDHIDNDTLNNRRNNLRFVTRSQNIRNSRKTRNKTGYRGVSQEGNQFCARVQINGRRVRLGWYKTASKASKVYDAEQARLLAEIPSVGVAA